MISKRVLLPATAGLGTLCLCLAIPLSSTGPKDPEAPFEGLARRVGAINWLQETRHHAALVLNALMHPLEHLEKTQSAQEEPAKPKLQEPPLQETAQAAPVIPGFLEAIALYKQEELTQADAIAKTVKDPIAVLALEWVALRSQPMKAGFNRLAAFSKAHPGWPANNWLRRRMEEALYAEHRDKNTVAAFFADAKPLTPLGTMALAQALMTDERIPEAQKLIRTLWRQNALNGPLEAKIRADFGSFLEKTDFKSRADHLLYKEDTGPALRAAALAGPDVLALAQARTAVINGNASDKLFHKVAAPLKADPGYLFAEIQKLRRADKIKEAIDALLKAPRDPERLVNGDEWWIERRLLARKALDLGDAKTAYKLCTEHSASSSEMKMEAEFHAGWIALRFLSNPALAAPHFAKVAEIAGTPMSITRARYWQGRAAEADNTPDAMDKATAFYQQAALYPTTYYGQLSRARLGLAISSSLDMPPSEAGATPASLDQAGDAVKVIDLLFSVGERDFAVPLATEAARYLDNPAQVASLGEIVAEEKDAHLSLMVGKLAAQRGILLNKLAYPTYGIPSFEPLQNSASKSIVYSIARQESAFNAKALSKAGAKGLMQMIASTAKRTAEQAGLPFDENRLLNDATFNAQLGAAHLGALLAEQNGSLILTFAAYNAGGRRVKQWIEAYGDPRTPGVDPIDWVERIPFTETRNYVQRVMENVVVYQVRFGETTSATRDTDGKPQAKL